MKCTLNSNSIRSAKLKFVDTRIQGNPQNGITPRTSVWPPYPILNSYIYFLSLLMLESRL